MSLLDGVVGTFRAIHGAATLLPCPCKTSIYCSFVTICSASNLFLGIIFLSRLIVSHRLVQSRRYLDRVGQIDPHQSVHQNLSTTFAAATNAVGRCYPRNIEDKK